jgi:cytochrome c
VACHGPNAEGTKLAPQLVGTKDERGKPIRTAASYWPFATTIWDYIRRAMPFNAPGSLSADEVYAVTAYILGEAQILDKSTVLDAQTLPRVQMPNRDGFVPDPRPELFK